jgi:U1 small nuclear ribonucleoprotein
LNAPEDFKLRRSRLISRFRAVAFAAATVVLVTWSGNAFAQSFDLSQLFGGGNGGGGGYGGSGGGYGGGSGGGNPLSQLFGGGSGGGQQRHQQQGNASGISVDRSAPPYTGKFAGSQEDQGAQTTLSAQFACYPASDADIPTARAFVCYTGGSGAGGPPPAGGPPSYGPPPNGGPSAYGPPNGGPPPYGPPNGGGYGPPPGGGPPNGPPPDGVE